MNELVIADSHNAGCIPYLPDLWNAAVKKLPQGTIWESNLVYLEKLVNERYGEWHAYWRRNQTKLVVRSVGAFGEPSIRASVIEREVNVLKRISRKLHWLDVFSVHLNEEVNERKKNIVLMLEDAELLLNMPDPFKWLQKNKISIVQPLYNFKNSLGCGLYSRYDSGLTSLGKDFIDALSKDGFIIDMSHASEKSIRDTMKVINNNVVVTHGTTFEIDKHSRGWRNSILKELSERCQYFGQIIGPVPLPKKHVDYVRFVLQRIEYAVRFFGYNKVGIASDWQWGWEEPCVLSMLDLWESHYHKQKVCENWRQMGLSVKGFIPLNFLEVMIEEKHSLDAVRHVAGRNLINCLVHRKSE